ncbi:MAG: glutamine synthetase family protein [Promethearchaeota archaeon]
MEKFSANWFNEKGIDYIQFQFTTLLGEIKEVEFPAKNWEDMKNGTGVDGSSLGFLSTEQSDMRAMPDIDTFAVLPWDPRVGRFICNLMGNDNKPYSLCPRGILKKILKKSGELGYIFKIRPELEWYFLDEDLESADFGDYMCTTPKDPLHEVRRQITDDMLEMFNQGAPHTIHHEVGPAQHEIELVKLEALKQADNVQTGKFICKTEANLNDLTTTFMAKPFPDKAGNGLHLHVYLEDKEGNNMFGKKGGISDELKYFVGGVLKHADALCAVLNPSTNSYKRLVPNHEAPVYKAWGIANRTALVRVPGYESKANIEYRAGDGSMNIYFGIAALIAAGLDGIEKKLQPNTPTTKNVDHLSDEERQILNIERLPEELSKAIDAFEKDSLMDEIFGSELCSLIASKNRQNVLEYNIADKNGYGHEWELEKYLDC